MLCVCFAGRGRVSGSAVGLQSPLLTGAVLVYIIQVPSVRMTSHFTLPVPCVAVHLLCMCRACVFRAYFACIVFLLLVYLFCFSFLDHLFCLLEH